MKTIEFKETGTAYPDAKAEQFAKEFLTSNADYLSVSTENFFYAIRCLVCEGNFPHDQVVFKFQDNILHLNDCGRIIENYPFGFCDYVDNWLRRLMKRI